MSLHIEKLGHGPPLVMIHGWGMHGGMWMQATEMLSKHFCLHIIDLPGMGESAPLPNCTLDELTSKIEGYIPKHSILLGWSLGALIAMKIASHFPVDKLILVGSTPCFVNKEDWKYGIPIEIFETFFSETIENYESAIHKLLALIAMGGGDARGSTKRLKERFATKPLPDKNALRSSLSILLEADLRQEVSQIKVPTLLIHGDHDKLAPLEAAVWLSSAIPLAKLCRFNQASHEPFISDPELFTQHIVHFCLQS
jgi:pimeloyl-[acyl-carrier protein] methyl ester esterase